MTFKIFETLAQTAIGTTALLEKRYCATINRLPLEHREFIYVLIYHYYITFNCNSKNIDIPYLGKIGTKGRGVGFEAANLPVDLQKIIVQYLNRITIL